MNRILRKIKDWWEGKAICQKHGAAYLYRHGYYNEWECSLCQEELMKKYE